jgi:hypothetical protein
MQVLDHTSKEDDRQGGEDQVVQQDESVLVQIGGVEAGGIGLASALDTKCAINAHLLTGKNQNMGNVQMTFYLQDEHPQLWVMKQKHTL